ncbi:SIS domain-containing protein [Neobacillus sp. NPDC097160]|uniref:SIS domain-containing protein n=1 Tax=Neobacillus sp. NPDC097160 TaxID=3364298 RepID=UPI00382EC0BD
MSVVEAEALVRKRNMIHRNHFNLLIIEGEIDMLNFDKSKYLEVTKGALSLREQAEFIIDEISNKGFKNIFLIGSGGSIAIMYPFEYILNSTSTKPVYAKIAAEFMLMNDKHFGEESLVILSSLSGTTQETVAAAKFCKEKGATTIGLVGYEKTPLGDLVDYKLVNFCENDFASDSINLQLYILIFRLMHNNNDFPEYDKFVSELQSIPEKLVAVKHVAEGKAEEFAQKYKDETYHMVVASGNLWGKAYSYAMCVLEEMQWIRTKTIHAAEFFHGTLELVEEDTSILVLKGEDETVPLIERVEKFAEKYTNKLTVFDTKDYEMDGISEQFRGYLSPLIMGTVLQRLSVHLEDKRNHSLDLRRYYRTVAY